MKRSVALIILAHFGDNIFDIESSTTRRVSEEHSTKKYNTTVQFTNQELLFAEMF